MDPGFLIASPQLRDPNFNRAVVLLVHHDARGALGVVINREHTVRLGDVVTAAKAGARSRRAVLKGGPVEPGAGFVIFRGKTEEGWEIPPNICVSGSKERMEALLRSGEEFFLCLGYAGWGPGQLEQEVETGSWVYSEASPTLVFECPLADRYDRALALIGVSAQELWMNPVDE